MSHAIALALSLAAFAGAAAADDAASARATSTAPAAAAAPAGADARATARPAGQRAAAEAAAAGAAAPAPGGDVKMSGMSILGNEDAPKSLVLVPWKSSQLGDMPSVSRLLDSAAQPVDKDVFMRELAYYEFKAGSK